MKSQVLMITLALALTSAHWRKRALPRKAWLLWTMFSSS